LEYLGSTLGNELAEPGQAGPIGADLGAEITLGIRRVTGVAGDGRQ